MGCKVKTKTATIIVYPVRGTCVAISALIEYNGKTEWNHCGADVPRAHMLQNAIHAAKGMGFTHAKVWHEFRDSKPADGGRHKL